MDITQYPNHPVLLVDDEIQALQSYEIVLRSSGITNIMRCQDSRTVLPILAEHAIELMLLDLTMPYVSGEEILTTVTQEYPEIPIIIVTGANDVEIAVRCMKAGAFDYMVKPVERSRLVSGIKRAMEMRDLRRETTQLRQHILSHELRSPEVFSSIITRDETMHSIFHYVEAIAGTAQPVLLTGETGVGKELMARAIHQLSERTGHFVAVNVAGLDDTIFADTLFGHRRGAFTGAEEARSGLVETAASGTLFLDEIGDLQVASQLKLLRLLQEREFFPLGADMPRRSDARIIVSTNEDLTILMTTGRFRKDLYYRLRIHHIHIPPLRERLHDLPDLVEYFLEEAARMLGKKKPTPPPELIALLSTYSFPGNIRELQSMVFDAVSKHTARKLSMDMFKKVIFEDGEKLNEGMQIIEEAERQMVRFGDGLPTLKQMDNLLIQEAMRRARGNQTIAARLLGISQQALSKRLKHNKFDR